MGLLLSVLVVCVGVLEVLACVRHFQDGYLPLWTPHCAVTSGYTASYERWRKKPSDSCEFRSFDDVNGYSTEKVLTKNCLTGSSDIQNGFNGKQADKAEENMCPSTDLHCQQSKTCSENGLSPSIDDRRKDVISCHNIPDNLASTLEPSEVELKIINKNFAIATPDCIPDIPEHSGKTKEVLTAEISSDLPNEKNPVNVSTEYRGMISHTQSESAVLLGDLELERTFSRDEVIEKYSVSDKEIDIEHDVPVLNACDESCASTFGVINEGISEGDFSDGCLGGKTATQNVNAVRLEENLEILSSNLCGENILDTALRDTLLSAVETEDRHVPVSETERNISVSDSMTERNSVVVPGPDQMPSTQTEVQVPSPDSVVDKFTSSVTKLEEQIQPTRPEVSIPSCLQTQEDKSIIGLVERENSSTCGEIFGEPGNSDSSSRNESVDAASCLNNADSFQNSFVPHFLSGETSITPMKVSSEYSVRMPVDGLQSRHTDLCEQPDNSPESFGVRKELSDWNIQTEPERSFSAECAEQSPETCDRKGKEAFNGNFDHSCFGHDTESGTDIERWQVFSQDANVRNITFEESPNNERSLGPEEGGTGTRHAVVDPSIARDPCSPDVQKETETGVTNEDADEHVSESCLDSQTILTDSVISRDEGTLHDIDLSACGDLTKDSGNVESSNLQASSDISVTPFAVNPSVQLSASVPPLSINTALETHVSVTPLPTDHQPSVSPPKVPSTPKRSKADISWPTFFPGTPVIKRPSVSFATPESVFANDDDEGLHQYLEESSDLSCLKVPDDISTATESDSTASTSEGRLLESVGISERSDSLEEPDPIIYRERSPSSIASGNDFSRKELKLQRRRSYKQKRYNSAVGIKTHDEETEDRSFSENNPVLSRASSVREPKKRYRQPAKSSSCEDILLHDIKTEGAGEESMTNTTEEISYVLIQEGRETEREETKHKQENFEETKLTNDIMGCPTVSTERNESKFDESKPEGEEKWIGGNGTEGQTEDNKGDDDEEYSLSEEQSSSQQKSPPKEAFWLIFSGEYTKAMSKDWHSGHFCCWQCDESLTGQRYVLRDDHPYCIKCYESVFANVCEECNKTIGIDSKDLSYKDKHWHEACFLCSKCRVSLVDKQFGSKADKIYCGNCYDAQFASRCDGCGEIFRAGTKKMEYKTRQWHEKCFCCCVCKTAIGTKSFIPREQEIYCATCYEEKFATRCVKCNKIITSGGVTYKNEPWHRECFTCTHCNTSLAGQRFTSRDEKPYCADCFGELFAKRCTACSKPITGIGGTRFISFEDRHWHNDCFICASCKTSLVGRGFITDAEDIICPECAKQKLM